VTAIISYVVPAELLSGADAEAVLLSSGAAKRRGEPRRSRFAPTELAELLHTVGFNAVEQFGPAEYERLYFRERADGLVAPSFERLIVSQTRVAG